jgi:predicted MFS family arabinose efflux permease
VKKVGFSTEPLRPTSRLQSPWFILIIVVLTSIAASFNQFKVPPVMPLLMEAFSQSASRAGLLMSVFALTGLFLAIPAGFILQKIGYRAVGLLAIFCLILGAGQPVYRRGRHELYGSGGPGNYCPKV